MLSASVTSAHSSQYGFGTIFHLGSVSPLALLEPEKTAKTDFSLIRNSDAPAPVNFQIRFYPQTFADPLTKLLFPSVHVRNKG
jgi:hypothetical protein